MSVWRRVLIIYDIEDNKTRYRVFRILESYGRRVQRSAFECYVDDARLTRLTKRLRKIISDDDNVRLYYTDRSCLDVGRGNEEEFYSSRVVII